MQLKFNPRKLWPAAEKIYGVCHKVLLPLFDFDNATGLAFGICQTVIVSTLAQLAVAPDTKVYHEFIINLLIGTLIWTGIAMVRMAHNKWRTRHWWDADPTAQILFWGTALLGFALLLSTLVVPLSMRIWASQAYIDATMNIWGPRLFVGGIIIGIGGPAWTAVYYKIKEYRNRIPEPKPIVDAYATQPFDQI